MSRVARGAIVLAYTIVFWGALPLALFVAGQASERMLAIRPLPARPFIGATLVIAGTALLVAAIGMLWQRGRGLPVGALPPPRLVTSGPYRLCRHPIYLGFNLALAGLALALGQTGLALIVAPAFLPLWMVYARLEERGLVRRFGDAYRRYRRNVGMLPRFPWYRTAWLIGSPILRVRRIGALPRGPVAVVVNHRSYLDPFLLAASVWRALRFPTTAEVFRVPALRFLLSRASTICVRRYRVDVGAAREVRRSLADGDAVVFFVEGERSVSGAFLGCPRDVGRFVAALGVPVVPCALIGTYDVGPRFAGILRRRCVTARFGERISLAGAPDPARAITAAIAALLDDDPPPITLQGLPRARLARVLWACPRCFAEPFDVATLSCHRCGLAMMPTADGRLRAGGETLTLAEWAAPLFARARAGEPLADRALLLAEESPYGSPRPLALIGEVPCRLDGDGLVLGTLSFQMADITRVLTERADTVEFACGVSMWQFKPATSSAFRWHVAIAGCLERTRAVRPG
jgi:1-acyl-sn-glycerol-3-phosphate acyltransferase/isoprenylcysteine carboxyl methyltransferase (ICMT) family protein YpbQ